MKYEWEYELAAAQRLERARNWNYYDDANAPETHTIRVEYRDRCDKKRKTMFVDVCIGTPERWCYQARAKLNKGGIEAARVRVIRD